MKNLLFLIIIISASLLTGCNNKRQPSGSSRQADAEINAQWFHDAKFGMFIHWGPYSLLGGEWNGKQVPVGDNAEWIMKNLRIPVSEYREIAKGMNPVKFNAEEWVSLAKSTGMKYIVITAKHHDGFAMYHSGVSKYNINDWTQFGRDPLKELSEACAKEGIKFCVYYSHREDWEHPGGYGNDWDYDNDWGSDLYDPDKFTAYLEQKAEPQVRELLTNYGPIGLVWFDRGMYTVEQGLEFVNLVHQLQPATLVNGRVGHYDKECIGDYQSMSDNGMPPGGVEEYFETPMTLNQTWGYSKFDTLWKSPETVITRLVEIVSRGGNFLLNIGPMGNGEIPAATKEIFRNIAPWIERNAEGIYGTTASPFGELPWGHCTVKGDMLYLFVNKWPSDGYLVLKGLHNNVLFAELTGGKLNLERRQEGDSVVIRVPLVKPDNPFTVISLKIEGSPVVDPPVMRQDNNGRIVLDYLTASTSGNAVTRFNRKGGFHISKMTRTQDSVQWFFNVKTPGKYKISVIYAAREEWEGQLFSIKTGNIAFSRPVISAGGWYEYREFPVGYTNITNPGLHTLSLSPVKESDKNLMYLKSVTLIPVEGIKNEGWGASNN
ncbi:MAG TPA: alpha-L-fucosidase [Bacteroidales bacterium]|nr:alpha-L-fucosidase [Bacteroidales bacterium]